MFLIEARTNGITRGVDMNRFWRLWKAYILPTSIPISALTIIITICMLDSNSWIPTAICAFNLIWMLMILIVNDPARDKKKRRGEQEDIEIDESDIA